MFKKMYLYLFNVITDALEEDNIEEIKKILEEDHGAELCCHFCNKKYQFTEEEIAELIKNQGLTHKI